MAPTNWWDGSVGLLDAAGQLVKRLGTRYQSRATILLDLAGLSANVGDRREAQRLVQQVHDLWSRRLVAFQP